MANQLKSAIIIKHSACIFKHALLVCNWQLMSRYSCLSKREINRLKYQSNYCVYYLQSYQLWCIKTRWGRRLSGWFVQLAGLMWRWLHIWQFWFRCINILSKYTEFTFKEAFQKLQAQNKSTTEDRNQYNLFPLNAFPS